LLCLVSASQSVLLFEGPRLSLWSRIPPDRVDSIFFLGLWSSSCDQT
jgi:hypothetical protein